MIESEVFGVWELYGVGVTGSPPTDAAGEGRRWGGGGIGVPRPPVES